MVAISLMARSSIPVIRSRVPRTNCDCHLSLHFNFKFLTAKPSPRPPPSEPIDLVSLLQYWYLRYKLDGLPKSNALRLENKTSDKKHQCCYATFLSIYNQTRAQGGGGGEKINKGGSGGEKKG